MLMEHNRGQRYNREAEEKQKLSISFENTNKLDNPVPKMIKKKDTDKPFHNC